MLAKVAIGVFWTVVSCKLVYKLRQNIYSFSKRQTQKAWGAISSRLRDAYSHCKTRGIKGIRWGLLKLKGFSKNQEKNEGLALTESSNVDKTMQIDRRKKGDKKRNSKEQNDEVEGEVEITVQKSKTIKKNSPRRFKNMQRYMRKQSTQYASIKQWYLSNRTTSDLRANELQQDKYKRQIDDEEIRIERIQEKQLRTQEEIIREYLEDNNCENQYPNMLPYDPFYYQ